MNNFVFLTLCIIFLVHAESNAQQVHSLSEFKADNKEYENVKVLPLHSDEWVSSFIIFVKSDVPAHFHKEHTEQVVVLEGKGVMKMGAVQYKLRKGDLIIIPKGVVHSVEVTGRKPMKVLSIQAPEFDGKDRIFVESD